MIMNCPFCNSDAGYYTKQVVRFIQHHEFDKSDTCAGESRHVSGGKVKYCEKCNKNITKYLPAI